jgi:hypothetical protein
MANVPGLVGRINFGEHFSLQDDKKKRKLLPGQKLSQMILKSK